MIAPSRSETPILCLTLVKNWLKAVCSHNVNDILSFYSIDAVLLGTIAENIEMGVGIEDYFKKFVKKEPCGEVTSCFHQQLSKNILVANGTYVFTLKNEKGGVDEVNARFTFIFKESGGVWRIKTHHSSEQPV